MPFIRDTARRILRARLLRTLTPLAPDDLQRPALVLAPHPDDESLPCGGLILHKTRADVPVWIAFVTDGSRSHPQMDPTELRERRRREGDAAAARLGVDPSRIIPLDFPDGQLNQHTPACAQRLREILDEHPEITQIILPCSYDVHEDHMATNRAARFALAEIDRPIVTLEYAVWFWEHWPWLRRGSLYPCPRRRYLKRSVISPHWAQKSFNRILHLDDETLKAKLEALEQHESQMSTIRDGWLTLRDVSGGEFVDLFSTPWEIYIRSCT